MSRFSNARDAKEFLVGQIVAQAQREAVPLSEVEQKMLYFSEHGWAPADIMETSSKFDSVCNQREYEEKIALLIRNARNRVHRQDKQELEVWADAIRALRKEDHYLLVMVDQAGASLRPPGDRLKLVGVALAIIGAGLLVVYLLNR